MLEVRKIMLRLACHATYMHKTCVSFLLIFTAYTAAIACQTQPPASPSLLLPFQCSIFPKPCHAIFPARPMPLPAHAAGT